MSKVRLTAGRIDKLVCPTDKSQVFLFDSEIQGLAVRATPAGSKSFIFESKLNRQTIRMTIGSVQTWTIDAAYKEARRLKSLCDAGSDPRLDKAEKLKANERKYQEAQRHVVTLGDVWPRYLEAHKNTWGVRHYRDHVNLAKIGGEVRLRSKNKITIAAPLAALLPVRLSDLTSERLESWLTIETKTRPTSAALAFRLLRACLNWCDEQSDLTGLIPINAHRAKKVRAVLPRVQAHDGCLQKEQLPIWFNSVKHIPNAAISAYLQSLLLTGARREELAELGWDDVDFRWKSILLKDKVEGERIIPLTPYVAYLLSGLPRVNQWVFASTRSESGRITEPRIAHNRALMTGGLPHLTSHDLRRSFGTLAEWVECPVGISAQIMGHKPSALAEKHYRRRPLDLLRQWHEKIESWILNEAGIPFDAETLKGRLFVVNE
ncbi:MAG: integrase family protein [Gammaproteobacteria bacterium]|nr:integrase family protein [Gammaproteobacteria bacterium]